MPLFLRDKAGPGGRSGGGPAARLRILTIQQGQWHLNSYAVQLDYTMSNPSTHSQLLLTKFQNLCIIEPSTPPSKMLAWMLKRVIGPSIKAFIFL